MYAPEASRDCIVTLFVDTGTAPPATGPYRSSIAQRLRRLVLIGATAVILVGLLLVIAYAYTLRTVEIENLQREMEHTARGTGEYLRNTVEAIDLRMSEGVRRFGQWQAGARRDSVTGHELLRGIVENSRHLNGIGWMDANGYLIASSIGPQRRAINVYDEPHFQAQLAGDAGLYMSPPIISRQDGRRIFTLSRRLTAPDGTFAGVVTGFSDLKGLADGMNAVRANPDIGLKLVKRNAPGEPLIAIAPTGSGGELMREVIDIPGSLNWSLEISADVQTALTGWHRQVALLAGLLTLLALTAATGAITLLRLLSRWETADAALQLSSFQLREAQRLAQMGSWELDIASGRLVCSDEIYRIHEMDPGRIVVSHDELLNPVIADDRTRVEEAYKGLQHTGNSYDMRFRLRMADGRIKWVHERCEGPLDTPGKSRRMVGTLQDVTREVEAANEVRQARELLQRIVDGSPDWIFAKDMQHRFVMVNEAFATSMGLAPQRLLGRMDSEILLADSRDGNAKPDLDVVHEEDRIALSGGEFRNSNDRVVFADGTVHILDTLKGPLRNRDGDVSGLFCISRDVTERRRFMEDLQRLNDSLEVKVAQRTQDLVRAKELAESANQAKTDFLSCMSHELRTPLNGILGFSEYLNLNLKDPGQREDARMIHNAGTHLLQLVNDLLDMSKIEARRMELSLTWAPLEPLVRELKLLHQAAATQKGILVSLEFSGHLPRSIYTDATRFRQILNNLLHNAVKFTAKGEVRLSVRPAVGGLTFEVRDTGVGIAPEDIPRLFERFLQLDRFNTRRQGGAGLGLALARELAVLLGGNITVESTPGIGSTFTIWHPLG